VELCVNFFDTAMMYSMGVGEVFLGCALCEIGVKRDHIVIPTKIPGEFLNPIDIFRSVEKSFRNLGWIASTCCQRTGRLLAQFFQHASTPGQWSA